VRSAALVALGKRPNTTRAKRKEGASGLCSTPKSQSHDCHWFVAPYAARPTAITLH
jgi:hypothetical protein